MRSPSSPQDASIRNLAVQAGKRLAGDVNKLARRVETVYGDFGRKVDNLASEINQLTEQVRKLNLQIVSLEGGDQSGERGRRPAQPTRRLPSSDWRKSPTSRSKRTAQGAVNVSLHGELLVFEGTRREVGVEFCNQ